MAKFEFKLPDIGEGVTEGEIVGWLAKVGDQLAENQDMVEVMTDKATVTIGSPKAGRVVELRGAVGDTVPVGSVIVVLEMDSGAEQQPPLPSPTPVAPVASPPAKPPAAKDEGPVASAVGDLREDLPGMGRSRPQAATPKPDGAYFSEQALAAPATRKLARELGVDLRRIEPSGKGGRVTREDVEAASQGAVSPTSGSREASVEDAAPGSPAPSRGQPELSSFAPVARQGAEVRQPIRGLRKRIYENMARSKRTAAHFTYVDEVDVEALMALRERLAARAEKMGAKLTFLPFIVKAVVRALKVHASLNALVDDTSQEIVLRGNYDIGIATATDAGLIVPVVRNADQLSLLELAQEIQRLGSAARSGRVAPADLGGSSFTITSLGKLGGLFATPVVNYPEVAILGVHEIKRRPVVRGDEIVIGNEMLLSLSFDHRIIDGHVGAAFAQEIIGLLEDPERLLLEA